MELSFRVRCALVKGFVFFLFCFQTGSHCIALAELTLGLALKAWATMPSSSGFECYYHRQYICPVRQWSVNMSFLILLSQCAGWLSITVTKWPR